MLLSSEVMRCVTASISRQRRRMSRMRLRPISARALVVTAQQLARRVEPGTAGERPGAVVVSAADLL